MEKCPQLGVTDCYCRNTSVKHTSVYFPKVNNANEKKKMFNLCICGSLKKSQIKKELYFDEIVPVSRNFRSFPVPKLAKKNDEKVDSLQLKNVSKNKMKFPNVNEKFSSKVDASRDPEKPQSANLNTPSNIDEESTERKSGKSKNESKNNHIVENIKKPHNEKSKMKSNMVKNKTKLEIGKSKIKFNNIEDGKKQQCEKTKITSNTIGQSAISHGEKSENMSNSSKVSTKPQDEKSNIVKESKKLQNEKLKLKSNTVADSKKAQSAKFKIKPNTISDSIKPQNGKSANKPNSVERNIKQQSEKLKTKLNTVDDRKKAQSMKSKIKPNALEESTKSVINANTPRGVTKVQKEKSKTRSNNDDQISQSQKLNNQTNGTMSSMSSEKIKNVDKKPENKIDNLSGHKIKNNKYTMNSKDHQNVKNIKYIPLRTRKKKISIQNIIKTPRIKSVRHIEEKINFSNIMDLRSFREENKVYQKENEVFRPPITNTCLASCNILGSILIPLCPNCKLKVCVCVFFDK